MSTVGCCLGSGGFLFRAWRRSGKPRERLRSARNGTYSFRKCGRVADILDFFVCKSASCKPTRQEAAPGTAIRMSE